MHQQQRYDQRESRDRAEDRNRDLDRSRGNGDIARGERTYGERTNMDAFTDRHREIAEQLRKNPALINNKTFAENHPALKEFLASHPEVREQLKENPNAVLDEQRFEQRENRIENRVDRNVSRGESASMDRFMDSHPEIAEQLRKDPSLVDNKQFVQRHPALQEYPANHPGVREEYKENPNGFMRQEQRFDRNEDSAMRRNGDTTRGELASMDRFMDSHPEIAEQLRKDPSLVDNKQFVQRHPALQEYLANHPEVRQEYRENPSAFMRQEQRFERNEDSALRRNGDMNRGGVSSFHDFLEGHGKIAGELSKNPSLATNQEYLENHPALHEYLQAHPQVHQELRENPQSFVKSAQHLRRRLRLRPTLWPIRS
jgi:hypothetical protein